MKSYIYTLIVVSVIGGLSSSFLSSFGNIKKYVNYFISILTILCLLSPIIEIVSNVSNIKDKISDYFENIVLDEKIDNTNDIIINSSTEAISKGIKTELINYFGFDEKDLYIELEIDKSNIESVKITKINVVLTGKASWSDVDTVKSYLKNIIGGNISVTRR